jgi:hypothetical protein
VSIDKHPYISRLRYTSTTAPLLPMEHSLESCEALRCNYRECVAISVYLAAGVLKDHIVEQTVPGYTCTTVHTLQLSLACENSHYCYHCCW